MIDWGSKDDRREVKRRKDDALIATRIALVEHKMDAHDAKMNGLREIVDITLSKVSSNSKDLIRSNGELRTEVLERINKTSWYIITALVAGLTGAVGAVAILFVKFAAQ